MSQRYKGGGPVLKLSILDQAPISNGQTPKEALDTAVNLAQLGDTLGYERYWIAEHHDLFGLACPNPSVMISLLGAKTERIRLGAGAVLLPYYQPFQVAETYNLLQTLYPNRIDIGLGRAPGGSAEVSLALSHNYLQEVAKYSEKIDALQQFLTKTVPEDSQFAKINPTPLPDVPPAIWLLGTSEKSALLAAEKGMPYAFGHFMTSSDGAEIVETYREKFNTERGTTPYVIGSVEVVCADTEVEAERIALSSMLWKVIQEKQVSDKRVPSIAEARAYDYSKKDREKIASMRKKMIIGNPDQVKEKLMDVQKQFKADEWMIITITHEPEAKFRSYELLQEMF